MDCISRTIKVNILVTHGVIENILLGASCSTQEVESYKALFQEFHNIFAQIYAEMPGLDLPIIEHCIET